MNTKIEKANLVTQMMMGFMFSIVLAVSIATVLATPFWSFASIVTLAFFIPTDVISLAIFVKSLRQKMEA